MEIKTIKSKYMRGIMDQNTYIVISKNEAVIIDAGAELADVKQAIGERRVLAVLMTHLHFDHFWNLAEYLAEFDCSVFVTYGAEEKLNDGKLNCSFLVNQNIEKNIDRKYINYYPEDMQNLRLGDFEFLVIYTAGHSSDSVCLKLGDDLFTGDTIFANSIGRTDLYDSSNLQMKKSLEKIDGINFEFAYPGHGDYVTKNRVKKIIKYYL